jgi:glycosyltransferase involved in cell wall biosynthesis
MVLTRASEGETLAKRMIFHFPGEVSLGTTSGTSIMARRMLQGFKDIGYEVCDVSGNSRERARAVIAAKAWIDSTGPPEFLYSESVNFPTSLTDSRHLPRHPFMDFGLLRYAHQRGVPVGLFYGDMYWRFPVYRSLVAAWKRAITIPLFKHDLSEYARHLDVLFVPSMTFADLLPSQLRSSVPIRLLHPGGVLNIGHTTTRMNGPLECLYIGQISPPEHDITSLLQAAQALEDDSVTITVCCPRESWLAAKSHYAETLGGVIPSNVTVVHRRVLELDELYASADVFVMPLSSPYCRLAQPLKMFDAIAHGLPIIVADDGQSEAGSLVTHDGIGIQVTCSGLAIATVLRSFMCDPEQLNLLKANTIRQAPMHTWDHSAEMVADVLSHAQSPGGGDRLKARRRPGR